MNAKQFAAASSILTRGRRKYYRSADGDVCSLQVEIITEYSEVEFCRFGVVGAEF